MEFVTKTNHRSLKMKFLNTILSGFLLVSMSLMADESETPARSGAGETINSIPLPVICTIKETSNDGETWRQTGEMPYSFRMAWKLWKQTLENDQWKLVHTIPLNNHKTRRSLSTWQHGKRGRVHLMVWSVTPGKSGFSWGTVKPESLKSKKTLYPKREP